MEARVRIDELRGGAAQDVNQVALPVGQYLLPKHRNPEAIAFGEVEEEGRRQECLSESEGPRGRSCTFRWCCAAFLGG